jgi:ABC-type transport system involved in cytochrome c biogenesis permease component/outer membrane biosynthesis protein TonB
MQGLFRQFVINLKLHFRNRMAVVYSYLFPTMFLLAFWALYRYEETPLVRHIGELLTIAALGGACFGLPTTLVSERERGVWRRYKLAPVSTGLVVASTLTARYVLLVIAGLLQVVLAMALGMPLPRHPVEMLVAFTLVAFAFMGVGLVIAMLADNVPAVQALGQSVFLPMLIIGGVAVPLASLPPWAERLSGYLPGRYAVDVIQATANGNGLGPMGFAMAALVFIGGAGCLAGAKLFRWDQEQRFATQPGKGWVAVALAAWVAVGVSADVRRRMTPAASPGAMPRDAAARETTEPTTVPPVESPPPDQDRTGTAPSAAAPQTADSRPTPPSPIAETKPAAAPASTPPAPPEDQKPEPPIAAAGEPSRAPAAPPSERAPGEPLVPNAPQTWQAVTVADIERDLVFDRLPPDGGVVTPIAEAGMYPEQEVADQLATLAEILVAWLPGHAADPVQRTRNLLFVAAVVDVAQMPMEPYLPEVVYGEIRQRMSSTDLLKVLYWIAVHPDQGTIPTVEEFRSLGLRQVPPDTEELRNRAAIYGVKLLGRLTGQIR